MTKEYDFKITCFKNVSLYLFSDLQKHEEPQIDKTALENYLSIYYYCLEGNTEEVKGWLKSL